MATVLNKSDIVTKICQFRDHKIVSPPYQVAKLVAFAPNYGISVGGGWVGQCLDDNYAIDHESACCLKEDLYENFTIAPTNVFIEPDSKLGLTLEWVPSKPLIVTSKIDYINLYKSFAEYLEDIPGTGMFRKIKFKICFYPLYLSEKGVAPDNDFEEKLFSAEYFHSNELTVQTHGAIFCFDKPGTSEKS